MKALLPSNEAERLKALDRYKILDTAPEWDFDDITLLASHVCGTPIALITLVDEDRQWFKSKIGMTESETSRDIAFCAHGILQPDFFEVEDAFADERFAKNPLVTGEPKIRFYAGSPLVTPDGHSLGMLCVIDQVPRELSSAEKAALKALSRQVVAQLELRRNLAERKNASEALRESEERFRSYFELGLIGMAITSPAKGLIEVNDEICRILGYERSELLRMSWTEFTHPDDLAADVANFNRVVAGEIDGYSMDKRFIRKDGRVIEATISGKCLRRGDGSVDYFVALLQDVTERKRVEQSQRESQLRYETLVQSIDGIVWEVDPQTFTFTFVSKQAERILGYPLEQWFEGPSFWPDHIHPDDRDWAVKFCVDATARGEDHRFEYRMIAADGRVVWLNDIVSLHIAPDQSVILRGVMVDITERKQADEALRESETRFRQLAENISHVFWLSNWEGTLIHYVSPAYEKIWGRSCDSLYAEPASWMDSIHPNDRERIAENERLQLVSGAHDHTYRIVRPGGSLRWVRDRAFPVRDESGKLIRVAGIAEDITESKEAEERLDHYTHLFPILSRRLFEVQEEERRHLARELHDEIGQTLTAAKLNLQAAISNGGNGSFARLQETTAMLDRLLDQVRQISLDLRPSMLDDLGLVPALRSLLDQQGRRASVAVRFSAENMPENLDPEIQTTCFRIAQEAITNAVRHAGAAQIGVDLRGENGGLRLLVRDNGIGFDAGSAQAQTVGLGLIGIKERAALAGGRAKVISSPNQGTTIEVFLPLTPRGNPASRGLRQ